jgi:hypothetical protein
MHGNMRKALAYVAFLISGVLAIGFVTGWVDGIRRDGFSQTAYTLLHWPAVTLTVALPVLAIIFLGLGTSLLGPRESD